MTSTNQEPHAIKRRKHFLPRWSFQSHLIFFFVVMLIIGELLSGAVFYLLADREMTAAFFRAHSQIRSVWDILLPAVVATQLVTVVVIVVASAILLVWYSHRIAGPLSRMVEAVKRMSEGDFEQTLKIRAEDEIQSLATSLDHHTEYVSQHVRELRLILADLDGAVAEGAGAAGDPHVRQIIDSCRGRLRELTHHFKVRDEAP